MRDEPHGDAGPGWPPPWVADRGRGPEPDAQLVGQHGGDMLRDESVPGLGPLLADASSTPTGGVAFSRADVRQHS